MAETWIVPCNVRFFDVVSYLDDHKTIVWKRRSTIVKGDEIYIYVGAPYSQILFKCRVEEDELSEEEIKKNNYAISSKDTEKTKYMRLKMIHRYEEGTLPLKDLREVGLGQTQVQARADRKLRVYLDQVKSEGRK